MTSGRPLAVLLIAASTVLAVRSLLETVEPDGRPSQVPRLVEWAALLPAPRALVERGAVAPSVLAAAGWERDISPRGVGTARASGATAAGAAALAAAFVAPLLAVGLLAAALGAWWLPQHLLRRAVRRRRRHMARQLPDVLDVLALCSETGLSIDGAIRSAATRLRGPLSAELTATMDDLAMGEPRRAAFQALADRVGLDEMTRFVGALRDADELGAPLAETLRNQAAQARDDARRGAQRRAAKAGPKIQLVVALLMVPAALIMVMAVMATEMIRQIAPVFAGFS